MYVKTTTTTTLESLSMRIQVLSSGYSLSLIHTLFCSSPTHPSIHLLTTFHWVLPMKQTLCWWKMVEEWRWCISDFKENTARWEKREIQRSVAKTFWRRWCLSCHEEEAGAHQPFWVCCQLASWLQVGISSAQLFSMHLLLLALTPQEHSLPGLRGER